MWSDPIAVRTVAAVVETGTFDAAARSLHVTPSAVSQRVKALEQVVGQRLLVRSTPVRPTAAGEVVLRYARRLALLDEDVAAELGLAETHLPRLSVAVNADSLATWFLHAVARFTGSSDAQVQLHREDQTRTARMLEDGTVMAAVTARAEPVPGCSAVALGAIEYRAMAARSWVERCAPDGVDGDTLATAPRVDYDLTDTLQADWLADRGVDASLAPRHLVPSPHDFAHAVALGLGWGLLPAQHATRYTDDLVDLGGPTIRSPLTWQRWRTPSALLDRLTDAVRATAAELLAPPGRRD
jgi:LysR family transcriptional regulator (chromosome initiation inhibitor)